MHRASKVLGNPNGRATSVFAGCTPPTSRHADEKSATRFVTEIQSKYRDWQLVSVAREEGTLDDIRAILGNDKAIKPYRQDGKSADEPVLNTCLRCHQAVAARDLVFTGYRTIAPSAIAPHPSHCSKPSYK
jgi:hypothetical protein